MNCRTMRVSCVCVNTDATRRVLHALILHLPAYQRELSPLKLSKSIKNLQKLKVKKK